MICPSSVENTSAYAEWSGTKPDKRTERLDRGAVIRNLNMWNTFFDKVEAFVIFLNPGKMRLEGVDEGKQVVTKQHLLKKRAYLRRDIPID